MILPKILIYKERFSLEEFHVYEDGFNKDLFDVVSKCDDVISSVYEDMEGQYLSIFNAAYYLCADVVRNKFPFLKVKEYREYARKNTSGSIYKADAVLCMMSVILSDYPESNDRLMQAIRAEVNNAFYANFYHLWNSYSSISHSRVWERHTMKPDAFTEDFFMQNHDDLKWKAWTNNYSEREVREIVNKAGDLKEEKLNLLDAIIADAKANGRKDADNMFSQFYSKLEWELKDTPFGYVYRKKKRAPLQSEPALEKEDTSTQRIRELEAEIKSLRAQLKKLEEENKRKDDYIARMKTQLQELGKRAGNDFNFDFDNPVGTTIGHVENLTIKYEKP